MTGTKQLSKELSAYPLQLSAARRQVILIDLELCPSVIRSFTINIYFVEILETCSLLLERFEDVKLRPVGDKALVGPYASISDLYLERFNHWRRDEDF